MENKIMEALKELCVPMGNLGFRYIKTAVMSVIEDETILDNMTKGGGLYDTVAKAHDTTAQRAERCIRHGAEASAAYVAPEIQERYFGKVKGKVRNTDFIAGIAFAVKMQAEG